MTILLLKGAGQMGSTNTGERVSDPAVVQEFIDLMVKNGHVGLDTSRIYCAGTSEQVSTPNTTSSSIV